ncbi:MAG: DUF1460 domain-containing protein, partial [Ignavibacteria bacterium]|nr:DUF1460 domain-containing protein [Ignavibacteria bacterium]
RYRNGKMSDYHSRLHYFSDWIFENEKKGVLKNLSKKLGGEAKLTQKISFMSNHKELYPRLKTDNDVTKIKTIENSLNRREIFYISKGQILNTNAKPNLKLENILKDGDIIALVSSDETLDITHVTIAVKQKNKFHLLHAPKPNTKVQITEKSFEEYLRSSKGVQGFMVVRLVEPS